ncbi:roadblock/LC7 domain-containing protein [Streptomyces sp. NPDC058471]|uniref:roadblock/LC7 domain-containing protein n=1 Tax=Streptomyces sp. NPDC058471 TaxID=3346516 RepID=UPI00364E8520
MTETSTALQQDSDLEWLVNSLLDVPGVIGAVLASQDGLKVTYTRPSRERPHQGIDSEKADRLASVISGLYALANGVATLDGGTGRDLQLGMIKHPAWSLFVVRAGRGLPAGTPVGLGQQPGEVECALGVMTSPQADEGVIGHEMNKLVKRVAAHLQTPTRQSGPANGQ